VRGKSLTARAMNIHFADQGLSTYTHVSDQHSTYGTKVLVPTTREAHYVLDDFLGNATDLPIREHTTDTHGVTLVNFALFDLVGKALTPRIRDLGKITLCRDDTPTVVNALYPHAGPLLGARLNEDLIADCWPDLLRMAGSLKYGEATASLIVGKWSAASRQNTLAAALKEWGVLRQTIHAAKYLGGSPATPPDGRGGDVIESPNSRGWTLWPRPGGSRAARGAPPAAPVAVHPGSPVDARWTNVQTWAPTFTAADVGVPSCHEVGQSPLKGPELVAAFGRAA